MLHNIKSQLSELGIRRYCVNIVIHDIYLGKKQWLGIQKTQDLALYLASN